MCVCVCVCGYNVNTARYIVLLYALHCTVYTEQSIYIYIVYIVYIIYIYIYIYIYTNFDGQNFKLGTDIVWVVEFKKGMRALARANRNFWPRTAILSTRYIQYNDIVRAVLR